jgi:CheY-like chemotaxis protein
MEGRPATRVLVGESYPEVRGLLERVLGEFGHEAVPHRRGWRSALPEIDVLVLDSTLEDGVELAEALRRDNPGLPVICTHTGPPGEAVDRLRPVAYLRKPFALGDLAEALREAASAAVAGRGRPAPSRS